MKSTFTKAKNAHHDTLRPKIFISFYAHFVFNNSVRKCTILVLSYDLMTIDYNIQSRNLLHSWSVCIRNLFLLSNWYQLFIQFILKSVQPTLSLNKITISFRNCRELYKSNVSRLLSFWHQKPTFSSLHTDETNPKSVSSK